MNNITIDNYDKLKKIINVIGNTSDLVTEDKTIIGAINEIAENSGGAFYTTTIAIEANTNIATLSDNEYTHNLGTIPTLAVWFYESLGATEVSGASVSSQRIITFECLRPTEYLATYTTSTGSSQLKLYSLITDAPGIWSALDATDTTIKVFKQSSNRPTGSLPAGSTIRIIVI